MAIEIPSVITGKERGEMIVYASSGVYLLHELEMSSREAFKTEVMRRIKYGLIFLRHPTDQKQRDREYTIADLALTCHPPLPSKVVGELREHLWSPQALRVRSTTELQVLNQLQNFPVFNQHPPRNLSF